MRVEHWSNKRILSYAASLRGREHDISSWLLDDCTTSRHMFLMSPMTWRIILYFTGLVVGVRWLYVVTFCGDVHSATAAVEAVNGLELASYSGDLRTVAQNAPRDLAGAILDKVTSRSVQNRDQPAFPLSMLYCFSFPRK